MGILLDLSSYFVIPVRLLDEPTNNAGDIVVQEIAIIILFAIALFFDPAPLKQPR